MRNDRNGRDGRNDLEDLQDLEELDRALRAALGDQPMPRLTVGFAERLGRRVEARRWQAREARRLWRRRRWWLLGYALAAGAGSLAVLLRGNLDLGNPWVLGTLAGVGLVAALLRRQGDPALASR